MTVLRLVSSLAVRGAFEAAIIPAFEAGTGCTVAAEWLPTTLIMEGVAAGRPADVLVVVEDAMDRLVAEGRVDAASRVMLVRSRVGVAVAKGAPHPDISTGAAFRDALLAARSVAWSRAGASGLHLATVLDRLGIAAVVNARATAIASGFTAERLLSGEADLAVQQVSELMAVPGVEIVGPFPDALQSLTAFPAAITRGAAARGMAERFLAAARTPAAAAAYRAAGVEPAF